jgi:hypothetical protein
MPQINPFQILCSLVIGLLRPFSIPLEMFCHEDVGERYPGFASVAALLTAEGWCLFSDDVFPLHALMVGFVVRLIVHRVMAIRRRLEGLNFVPSRSPGRPVIARLVPQVPEHLLGWLEPVALLLVSAVMCLLSSSPGTYLMCGSAAWLTISLLRTLAAYNRVLDQYDADPQAALSPMTGRYFEVLPPKPAIEDAQSSQPAEDTPVTLPASVLVPVQ